MAVIPISPSSGTLRYTPSTTSFGFAADRTVTWSANNGGSVSPGSGSSTVLTVPNFSQVVSISGISGSDAGSAPLTVWATFPVQPRFGYELDMDNKTLVSYSEDGTPVFRVKSGIRRSWQLQFPDTPQNEWRLIREFWNFHQKHIAFYYEDDEILENIGGVETPTLRLVTFDAGLKIIASGPDRYAITTVVREF